MSFAKAIESQTARTENGMKALKNTSNACVDLFFNIGASRGKDIKPAFVAAYVENKDYALRTALWARDARQGAGERQIFKDILQYLETNDIPAAMQLARKTSELGRWDDLLVFKTDALRNYAFSLIKFALEQGNGLCAKWMPRKGADAVALTKYLGLSPRAYRKTLVGLTKVVETQMCAKDWNNINFSHVPSVASARYKKAFTKNAGETYKAYLEGLSTGTTKVNASAVYPYDVIKTAMRGDRESTQLIEAQWKSLPNYVGNASTIPLVDVSGSMDTPVAGNTTALEVALSLGLYLSDKNTGEFKDCFLTFSDTPELLKVKGNIIQKLDQMRTSDWGMNTNLHAAFDIILQTAIDNNVPAEDMPKSLMILSDMQFDSCVEHDDSAIQMIRRKFMDNGYNIPNVIFWNLAAKGNAPVKFNEQGTALVSGFSPAIMTSLLADGEITPVAIMEKTILKDRYNYIE